MDYDDKILEFGVSLDDGYSIKPYNFGDNYDYTIFKNEKRVNQYSKSVAPANITTRHKVGKFIQQHTSNDEQFNRVRNDLEQLLIIYFEKYQEAKLSKQNKEISERRQKIEEALKEYKKIFQPLVWLGSNIDWLTAGERVNIMIAFLCSVSQVVLHNPISVIGIGNSSTGKTHVIETALSLLPDEFILREKKPTLAAMFRRSEQDEWYYHDKIVYYGDMGGDSDHNDTEDTRNILKELQTDGEVNRPVAQKKDGGDYDVIDMKLKGTPALYYTITPDAGGNNNRYDDSYQFDSQELSRSIMYKPRTDNKEIYDCMSSILELGGHTAIKQNKIKRHITKMMPYVVLGLREIFNGVKFEDEDKMDKEINQDLDIHVINPYHRVIVSFIGDSEYYKRDSDKYESILKAITVMNYYNHEVFMIDGEKVMFVTFDDIQYFITLMNQYRVTANLNLTPSESDILYDILKEYNTARTEGKRGFLRAPRYKQTDEFGFVDDYEDEEQDSLDELGVTVPNMLKFMDGKYSRRTLYHAFNNFVDKGIASIVEEDIGRASLYVFKEADSFKTVAELSSVLKLSDTDLELFEREYPPTVVDFLAKDKVHPGVSIFNQDKDISEPVWNKEKEE